MAQRFGGKIVTNGLVLCLDAHDAKSYAGEPITNMAYNIGILGQGSTWEAITSVPGSEGQTGPGANVNFKKLNDNSVANTFSNSNGKIFRNYVNNPATSDSSSFNNNGGFRYASSINLTSGGASGYVIISFWCYLVTGYTGFSNSGLASSYMQFNDSGGTYTGNGSLSRFVDGVAKTAPETFNADTGRWKFVQLRFTKPTNSTAIRNFYIYSDRNTQGEMYVCQLQIEDRSDSGFYQVPFVEGASSRSATDGWVDRSGNSNDGTLVNGTNTGVSHYRNGEVIMPVSASYLDFDGSDDYIPISSLLNQETINGSTTKTIILWLKPDSHGPMMAFSTGQNGNNRIYYWTQYSLNTWRIGNYTSTSGHATLPSAGTWFCTAIVINGLSVTGYLNGTQDYTGAYSAFTTHEYAVLGRHGTGSYYYDGKIGKVSVYNKALSAAEVLSNYNAMKPRFGL